MKSHQVGVSLIETGYAVIPVAAGSKAPGAGWRTYEATPERVRREWPPDCNIGIRTTDTPAVDIDCLDPDVADAMQRFVENLLGDTVVRVGRAPKRLLLFRTDQPFRKVDSGFWIDEHGREHKLEVLGDGQQFIAFGIHPDTGAPYRWTSLETPLDWPAAELPLIRHAEALAIRDEFVRLARELGWTRKGSTVEPLLDSAAPADPFSAMAIKPDVSDDVVAECIALLDNPGRDYDLWIKVGAALHNHFDGSAEGLGLWHEWSAKSPLYDSDSVDAKWPSFGRYGGRQTTAAFLLFATKQARATARQAHIEETVAQPRDELLAAIKACDDAGVLFDTVLPQVAAAKLDELSTDLVLKELNAKRKKLGAPSLSIALMHKRIGELRAPAGGDSASAAAAGLLLEKTLADRVLAMRYAGGKHITYFSGLWWVYRGGLWRRTEENMVASVVQDAVLQLQQDEDEDALRLAAAVAESRGDRLSAVVGIIVTTIQRIIGEDGYDDPLDLRSNRPPPCVINCRNGELWFELDGRMTFRPHNPDNRLTSQVACDYDPKAECPTFDAMLGKVLQRCDDPTQVRRHFEEVFGYLLQPTRHNAMCVMVKGPGGNGKSTVLDVIRTLMGESAVLSTSIADLSKGANDHFTDSAQGKLMLLDDDFRTGAILPDDWLKKFSEAKSLTANPKYGRQYQFVARCTPVILTNGWPQTVDLSEGIRRRMMVFEWLHVLTEAEKNPRDLMRVVGSELPGVLNRLVAGLQRVLERGHRFSVPAECVRARETWTTMSNPTARFVALMVTKTDSLHDRIPASELYDKYRQWVQFDEMNVRALGRNKFYDAMEQVGLKRRNHSGNNYFVGIRISDNSEIDGGGIFN